MSKQAWIIFTAVCVVVLGSLIYFSRANRVDVSKIDTNTDSSSEERIG